MLKPGDLDAMTPEDRTQLFQRLAQAFYGPDKTLDQVAAAMGYSRQSVYRWVRDHNTPLPVIYTLDAWVNGAPMQLVTLEEWQAVAAQLSDGAASIQKGLTALAKMAQRLSAADGGGGAS